MGDKTIWMIRISGYGTFEFEGTEQEAEARCVHKAQWEQGTGMKWRKDLSRESDRISSEIAGLWDKRKGVTKKLLHRLKKARALEANP